MKRKLIILTMLIICLLAMAGCTAEEAAPAVDAIQPLPVEADLENLEECTLAVSIEEGGITQNGSGEVQIKAKVYTYDLYDMEAVRQLEAGKYLEILGEPVEITKVEEINNAIWINGGLDEGGYELHSDDETTYYLMDYSDMLYYYEIGEITVPAAEDFVYTDASDLEGGEAIYSIDDLLAGNVDYNFVPQNTQLVIFEGKVSFMERIYTP